MRSGASSAETVIQARLAASVVAISTNAEAKPGSANWSRPFLLEAGSEDEEERNEIEDRQQDSATRAADRERSAAIPCAPRSAFTPPRVSRTRASTRRAPPAQARNGAGVGHEAARKPPDGDQIDAERNGDPDRKFHRSPERGARGYGERAVREIREGARTAVPVTIRRPRPMPWNSRPGTPPSESGWGRLPSSPGRWPRSPRGCPCPGRLSVPASSTDRRARPRRSGLARRRGRP